MLHSHCCPCKNHTYCFLMRLGRLNNSMMHILTCTFQPTNHLDIEVRSSLQNAIPLAHCSTGSRRAYDGTTKMEWWCYHHLPRREIYHHSCQPGKLSSFTYITHQFITIRSSSGFAAKARLRNSREMYKLTRYLI